MRESKKQIKAKLINEISKRYARRLDDAEERVKRVTATISLYDKAAREAEKKAHDLEYENYRLKDKVAQYEDWIERMQEFCGLPDGERQKAFATYMDGIKKKAERDEALKHTADFFGHFTSILFR